MLGHQRILAPHARPASLRSAASAGPDYGSSDQPDWREVRWPTHLRAMTIEGRRVHFAAIGSGDGAPILLIHGLGGRWQNWLENIPRLAAQRRVVAVDLPGFGHSQLPLEPISITGYARVLDRACDLLELDAAIVVGNSLGGAVATELALRHPARVRRLVLVAPAGLEPGQLSPQGAKLALAAVGRLRTALPNGLSGTLARPRARHLALATLLRHPTLIASDTLFELTDGGRAQGSKAALAALTAHDNHAELDSISEQTLIIHGRNDMLIRCEDSEQLASRLPTAELVIFEDTGHMPMLERPVPFNDELLRFAGGEARPA
jgi:pimeloyl-ACP methyl ester carboxylesterase